MDEKKIRKAIKLVEHFIDVQEQCKRVTHANVDAINEDIAAYKVAIEALEKQLPKKPTYEGDGYAPDGTFIWDEWLCPNCGSGYEVDYDDYSYCPNCGQRIDREEEEEL